MICVNCGYGQEPTDACAACGNDPSSAAIDEDTSVSGASAERRRIATALERIASHIETGTAALERIGFRLEKGIPAFVHIDQP
jgi:hypothetical protein